MNWIVDGNNVYGSRPDGWWNDRDAAAARFAQRVAEWCRTHCDAVLLVFDGPVSAGVLALAGGNLAIEEAPRRGRDAADHHIVDRVALLDDGPEPDTITVVTSDQGLRDRLPEHVRVLGVGRFRDMIGY